MKSKGLKMTEKNINLSAPYIGGYNNSLIIGGGCLLGQHDSLTCQFCTMGGAASRPHGPLANPRCLEEQTPIEFVKNEMLNIIL